MMYKNSNFACKVIYANWWKYCSIILVLYSIIGGFLFVNPNNLQFLDETIRNLNFHVPMWFSMLFLLVISFIYSIKYLNKTQAKDSEIIDFDLLNNKAALHANMMAQSTAQVAFLFGILGICTGSFWARFSWGSWWTPDPKLNGAAISLLFYAAYFIFIKSIEDKQKVGKFAAIYNIFIFPIVIVLVLILPKYAPNTLHPASGDTAGFSNVPLNKNLRMTFYPAILGWIGIAWWICTLLFRIKLLNNKKYVSK